MSRVLVVDDEETVLTSLEILLETEGHQVVKTTRPDEAAELLKKEKFDLLITDIRMVPLDGLALMRLARKQWPDMPFIAISAYASWRATRESQKLGCVAYIKKPFKVQEVVNIVSRALTGAKQNN